MKLAFSTIGCPDWNFTEIFSTAKDLGYDAVELRGVCNEMYAPSIKELTDAERDATQYYIDRLGVKISMLTSGACLADNTRKDTAVDEAKAYVDLARKLGVRFVRVMPTDKPYADGSSDALLCEKQFKEVVKYAEGSGVMPLMETNGIFTDTKLLAAFLDECGDNCGALWDVHHPFRFNDETVEQTVSNLSRRIQYVHLKDSVVEKGNVAYKMMGYGNVPLKDAINLLKENGYDGYYSLEWVKRWNRELEDAGIVFAHYVNYMRQF